MEGGGGTEFLFQETTLGSSKVTIGQDIQGYVRLKTVGEVRRVYAAAEVVKLVNVGLDPTH